MIIDIIDNIEKLNSLKDTWDKIYSTDRNAQIFLSWSWLSAWLEVNRKKWFILAFKPHIKSDYVAFFPIGIRSFEWNQMSLYRVLHTSGEPLADYTGFVCSPEYEEEAISSFANYIQQDLEWDYFHFREVLDPRLDTFIKYFPKDKFNIELTDGSACSHIALPDSWEEYLQESLTTKVRKNLRYAFRQVEKQESFYLQETTKENFHTQLDALLSLMQMQRGSQPQYLLDMYSKIFSSCLQQNNLWLNILWDNQEPVAGTGIFVDYFRKRVYGYMTGYSPKYSKLSPGRVMMAYSIRKAIENQFQTYDFLRGDESYKSSFFGVQKHSNHHCVINRNNLRVKGIHVVKQFKSNFLTPTS